MGRAGELSINEVDRKAAKCGNKKLGKGQLHNFSKSCLGRVRQYKVEILSFVESDSYNNYWNYDPLNTRFL